MVLVRVPITRSGDWAVAEVLVAPILREGGPLQPEPAQSLVCPATNNTTDQEWKR
jgi:hypothetical protein